jgi:hypothetical protein
MGREIDTVVEVLQHCREDLGVLSRRTSSVRRDYQTTLSSEFERLQILSSSKWKRSETLRGVCFTNTLSRLPKLKALVKGLQLGNPQFFTIAAVLEDHVFFHLNDMMVEVRADGVTVITHSSDKRRARKMGIRTK